jgi:transcriptional activator of cad operon
VDRLTAVPLRIGAWRVDPTVGQISRGEETVRVEARTMRLLLCLAQRAGEVVSIEDLLNEVWSGVIVSPDSVYQAVASLRRVLGDDPKRPTYIANVPRLGYRMVASVGVWADEHPAHPNPVTSPSRAAPSSHPPPSRRAVLVAAGILCLAFALTFLFRGGATQLLTTPATTAAAPKSVAVLPFLDLTTQDMNKEYFADGMTEELIDRLSKVPGLHVPGPTSSFYFKGKKLKVADIAKSLGVLYVLDGSIRKSDDTLRVAARLIRADDGYVVWSETYDRPSDSELKVQDEIAGEVVKALESSIN